jgi:hypothetical protein
MEAVSSKSRRPIIVEFLATLFVTFCIGIATSIVLCACVILMAGEARGAEFMSLNASVAACGIPEEEFHAKVDQLVTTHRLATRYAGALALDRTPAAEFDSGSSALSARLPEGGSCEAVFGGEPQVDAALPQRAPGSRFKLLAGAISLLFASILFMQATGFRRG